MTWPCRTKQNRTCHKVGEQSNEGACRPVEQQQVKVISWTGLVLVGFQAVRVLVEEVAVEHKVEPGLRVDRVEEDSCEEAPDLKRR